MGNADLFFIITGISFILVLLITALFSSTIVIIIIVYWRSRCHSVSNLLTVNSCTAFLVFVLSVAIQIPYLFQTNEKENNDLYTTSCRIRACFFLFTCVVKVLSYLIQALSRYFITVLHKHRKLLTYRVNIIMIILNWVLGLIIACGFLISPVGFQYEPESRFCTITSKVFDTSFTLISIAFLTPVNLIVILYVLILRHTTRTNRIQPNTAIRGSNRRNIKVFQNILMLLGIVVIGGTPCLLCILINKIAEIPWPLYSISVLFITFSAIVESITIFCTNKEVKSIFCTKICLRREEEERQVFTVAPVTKAITNRNGLNGT